MTLPAMVSWPGCNTRHKFSFMEGTVSPIRHFLVVSRMGVDDKGKESGGIFFLRYIFDTFRP